MAICDDQKQTMGLFWSLVLYLITCNFNISNIEIVCKMSEHLHLYHKNPDITGRIIEFVIISTVLALSIDKLFTWTIFGDVNLSLQIVVLLFSCLIIFFEILIKARAPLNNGMTLMLIILLLWFLFEGLRSVQFTRAITYILLLSLSSFLYIWLSSKLQIETIYRINKKIYYYGAAVSFILFADYVYILLTKTREIIGNRNLWDVGSTAVYEVQFGKIIAFQGFSGDPNAVGIGIAIIIFCGLSFKFRKYDYLRHIINLMLISLILASNSRGAMAALFISFIFGAFLLKQKIYKWYLLFSIVGIISLMLLMQKIVWLSNPIEKISRGANSRFDQWNQILESAALNPAFGNGLRYSEHLLGKYTENSYLTLLNETGVTGLFLYLFILLTPIILFLINGKYKHPYFKVTIPWVVYSIFLLLSMLYISMEVKPILWVTVGIISGAVFSMQRNIRIRV